MLHGKQVDIKKADFYELQQSRSPGGPWTTLSDSIIDTTYIITNASLGSYYYRARANRDNIWWDYALYKKCSTWYRKGCNFPSEYEK